jgi:hypothetical protein
MKLAKVLAKAVMRLLLALEFAVVILSMDAAAAGNRPPGTSTIAEQKGTRAGDRNGLTCEQHRDIVQSLFQQECLPRFQAMTGGATCEAMCSGDRVLRACLQRCSVCLGLLRTIDNTKNCQ